MSCQLVCPLVAIAGQISVMSVVLSQLVCPLVMIAVQISVMSVGLSVSNDSRSD